MTKKAWLGKGILLVRAHRRLDKPLSGRNVGQWRAAGDALLPWPGGLAGAW